MVPNGWLHKQIGEIASIQVGRDLVEDKYSEISTTEYKYPVYSNTVENKGLYKGYLSKNRYPCLHFRIKSGNPR